MTSSMRRLLALVILITVSGAGWSLSAAAAVPRAAAPTTTAKAKVTTTVARGKATTVVVTSVVPTPVASTIEAVTTTAAATTTAAGASTDPVVSAAAAPTATRAKTTGGKATATVNRIIGVLMLLGMGLIGLIVWYWRSTRPIVGYLEGLDLMATSRWRRANPLRREMMLEVLRLRRGPASVDPIAAGSHAPVVRVEASAPGSPLVLAAEDTDLGQVGRQQVVLLAPPDQDPLPPPALSWSEAAPAPDRVSPIRVEPIAQRFGADNGAGMEAD